MSQKLFFALVQVTQDSMVKSNAQQMQVQLDHVLEKMDERTEVCGVWTEASPSAHFVTIFSPFGSFTVQQIFVGRKPAMDDILKKFADENADRPERVNWERQIQSGRYRIVSATPTVLA